MTEEPDCDHDEDVTLGKLATLVMGWLIGIVTRAHVASFLWNKKLTTVVDVEVDFPTAVSLILVAELLTYKATTNHGNDWPSIIAMALTPTFVALAVLCVAGFV